MLNRREALAYLASLSVPALLASCGGKRNGGGGNPAPPSDSRLRPSVRDPLAAHVAAGFAPGAVAVVETEGRPLELEAFGSLQQGGAGGAVSPDTIFRIASMSKPITGAAAMLLVEEGKLRLEDPVERWLPELANRRVLRTMEGPLDDTVPANRPITVDDVLTFRLGWGVMMAMPGTHPIQRAMDEHKLGQGMPQPAATPAPDEWIKRLGTLPLMKQPGESWLYNTGSDVASVLIARASGQRFEAFLEERLFGPLGMVDTAFHVPADKRARFASAYGHASEDAPLQLFDGPEGQWAAPPAFPSGAGGLASTAIDYLAFARMLRNGGQHDKRKILSLASVERLSRDQLTPQQKAASHFLPGWFDSYGWSYGAGVITGANDLGLSPGAYGWDGGFGTSWWNDPARHTTGIILTQRAYTSPKPHALIADFWRGATA